MSFALLQQAPAGPPAYVSMLPIVGMFALMYFLLIRPQNKARKEMEARLAKLKSGDEVVLSSGFFATVDRVEEKAVWLKLGDKLVVKARKSAVVAFSSESEPQN